MGRRRPLRRGFARRKCARRTHTACSLGSPSKAAMARRTGGSFANLADLANAGGVRLDLSDSSDEEDGETRRRERCERIVFVGNGLPLRCKEDGNGGWNFEWDEDNLLAQAKVRRSANSRGKPTNPETNERNVCRKQAKRGKECSECSQKKTPRMCRKDS